MFKINDTTGKCGDIIQHASGFMPYAHKRLGFNKPVNVNFISDPENAKDPFGKTAYYDPNKMEITIFVDKRHVKDVLRSLSHELVHHAQNCRGEFDRGIETGDGYAQKDPHMRKMEAEAYLLGNGFLFRDYEDQLKENKGISTMKEDLEEELVPSSQDLWDDLIDEPEPEAPGPDPCEYWAGIGPCPYEDHGHEPNSPLIPPPDPDRRSIKNSLHENKINIKILSKKKESKKMNGKKVNKNKLIEALLDDNILSQLAEKLFDTLKENENPLRKGKSVGKVKDPIKSLRRKSPKGSPLGGKKLKTPDPVIVPADEGKEKELEEGAHGHDCEKVHKGKDHALWEQEKLEEAKESCPCEENKDCPDHQDCVDGECVDNVSEGDTKNENWFRGNKDALLFERLAKKWTK